MTQRTAVVIALFAVVAMAAACDTGDGKTMRPPTSEQRADMPTTTAVPATTTFASADQTSGPFTLSVPWADGGVIDARFTCDGNDVSPLMTWSAPPAGTVEMALLVTDDDASGYVHWAVAGIAPTAGDTGEGATIPGTVEGVNDAGTVGWSGPCPPAGSPHTYRFQLYALDQQAELPDGFTGADLEGITGPASIGLAEVIGTYTRAQ